MKDIVIDEDTFKKIDMHSKNAYYVVGEEYYIPKRCDNKKKEITFGTDIYVLVDKKPYFEGQPDFILMGSFRNKETNNYYKTTSMCIEIKVKDIDRLLHRVEKHEQLSLF